MASEADVLAARLARMKHLLESLEAACADSAKIRDTFQKLHGEMEAARSSVTQMRERRRSPTDRRRIPRTTDRRKR